MTGRGGSGPNSDPGPEDGEDGGGDGTDDGGGDGRGRPRGGPGAGGGADRATLRATAMGERPADLVVAGGAVVLPDGSLSERAVAVVGDRIATLPPTADPVTGPDTTVVDAADRTVVPGFVDAHAHVDEHVPPERDYHRKLARGTTTVVTETSVYGAAFGPEGVAEFLAATADLPLSVLATLPTARVATAFAGYGPDHPAVREELRALSELADRDRVVGAGELGWANFVGSEAPAYDELLAAVRAAGGTVAGHGAGATGPQLDAVAATVDNDHEPITPEAAVARLRSGLRVIGRAGAIRNDARVVADPRVRSADERVGLCTDGVWPGDRWGMADTVRAAVEAGIDPVDAVGMATRGSAAAFGLDDRGRVAPGARADLLVLGDLSTVAVETVVAGGEVVVRDGDPLVDPRPHDYPDRFRGSGLNVAFRDGTEDGSARSGSAGDGDRTRGGSGGEDGSARSGSVGDGDRTRGGSGGEDGSARTGIADDGGRNRDGSDRNGDDGSRDRDGSDRNDGDRPPVAVDLSVPAGASDDGRVLAIGHDGGMATNAAGVEPPVEGGELLADPARDVAKVVAVSRGAGRAAAPSSFVGFVQGLGIERGAIASTLVWEQPATVCVGVADGAIRRALRRVASEGGWAVVGGPGDDDGAGDGDHPVLATLPMGIGGVCADRPVDEVAADYLSLDDAFAAVGATPDPGLPRANREDAGALLAVQTLTFTGVPALRVTPWGYADVVDRRLVGLNPWE